MPLAPSPKWFQEARCRPDPDLAGDDLIAHVNLFFDASKREYVLREFCTGCPVRPECTTMGLMEWDGIWGEHPHRLHQIRLERGVRRLRRDDQL